MMNDSGSMAGNGIFNLNIGINGSTYSVAGQPGSAHEAYMANTGSNLLIGNQTTGTNSNIKFFSGNTATSFAAIITGSLTNIKNLSINTSGSITASGTVAVALDLSTANYFLVSGSGAGTVTWTVATIAPVGQAQTFIIEYINGGTKTNTWFTGIKWPAATAPILSTTANPDLLSFTSADGGTTWRGVLLQRGSA
jgi:hypothetical protein